MRKAILFFGLALMFGTALAAASATISYDEKALAASFNQQSIPVFLVQRINSKVVVKFRYQRIEDLSEEKMESNQIAVLTKITDEFPESEYIRLEYYAEEEIIISLEYKTEDVLRFSEGAINKARLIADASLDIQSSKAALFSSDPLIISSREEEMLLGDSRGEGEAVHASYFGAQYRAISPTGIRIVNILDDSPAQYAGLRIGDTILEIENKKILPGGLATEQVPDYIFSLPSDRPLRFHIAREGKRFDIYIKLVRLPKDQIDKLLHDARIQFDHLIDDGTRLLNSRDYEGAIRAFQTAVEAYPLKAFQGIGIGYFYKNYYDDAFYYLARAYRENKHSPLTLFYLSLTMDQWEKKDEAVLCFEAYMKENDSEVKNRDFARNRLESLKSLGASSSYLPYRTIDDMINQIIREEDK